MNSGRAALALATILGCGLVLNFGAPAEGQQTPVPDAPTPQAAPTLKGANGPITPGQGAGETTTTGNGTSSTSTPPAAEEPPAPAPSSVAPATAPDTVQTTAPDQGEAARARFIVNVNFVEVPVTVKDNKGNQVAGLTFRDFTVYENNTRVPLRLFSVDAAPLSVAFVIDQSVTSDVMQKVNTSLDAIQGALTPYDEAAVFTYDHIPKEWTGFTGAQSNRLPAVLSLARATGTDMQVPVNTGPFAGCNLRENGNCVDPNLQPGKSAGSPDVITIPKEIHTLNDAILMAAKELSTRPKERRRVIYVISDGKENGSKATFKEVVRYLETNKIAVYGTLVGDSARWGEGYLSKFHLPFQMYDNRLYGYAAATGGVLDSENGTNGIEKSYARIASEARNQYTLGYLSHESIYDGKYRSIEVRVDRPNIEVVSKKGYYPSSQDYK